MNFASCKISLTFCYLIVHLAELIRLSDCVSSDCEKDLRLSSKEKLALHKFKKDVISSIPLRHDYMTQDIYLIRWLRAKNYNQEEAKSMLLKNLHWRMDNKLDTILEEEWSDMAEYEYHMDGFDKHGRPVTTAPVGSWNIRNAIFTGRINRVVRHIYKMLEEASQKVMAQQNLGKNVTQWQMIADMEDFRLSHNACPLCLRVYMNLAVAVEEYYPGHANSIIFINAPPSFNIVLDIIRPLFSPQTAKTMKIFGNDKKTWMKYLDNEINRDQRRPMYGGTMNDDET